MSTEKQININHLTKNKNKFTLAYSLYFIFFTFIYISSVWLLSFINLTPNTSTLIFIITITAFFIYIEQVNINRFLFLPIAILTLTGFTLIFNYISYSIIISSISLESNISNIKTINQLAFFMYLLLIMVFYYFPIFNRIQSTKYIFTTLLDNKNIFFLFNEKSKTIEIVHSKFLKGTLFSCNKSSPFFVRKNKNRIQVTNLNAVNHHQAKNPSQLISNKHALNFNHTELTQDNNIDTIQFISKKNTFNFNLTEIPSDILDSLNINNY